MNTVEYITDSTEFTIEYYKTHNQDVISHDYSVICYRSPWIVSPLLSTSKIINIKLFDIPNGNLIHIPSQSELVKQKLTMSNIDTCLYDASPKDIQENRENDPTSPYFCFNGAEYIARLWTTPDPINDKIQISDNYYKTKFQLYQPISIDQIAYLNGVFLCDLSFNLEDHNIVLYFSETSVTVFNTYGGYIGFFVTEFDRKTWVYTFTQFNNMTNNDQYNMYNKMWGFPKDFMSTGLPRYIKSDTKIELLSFKISRLY